MTIDVGDENDAIAADRSSIEVVMEVTEAYDKLILVCCPID